MWYLSLRALRSPLIGPRVSERLLFRSVTWTQQTHSTRELSILLDRRTATFRKALSSNRCPVNRQRWLSSTADPKGEKKAEDQDQTHSEAQPISTEEQEQKQEQKEDPAKILENAIHIKVPEGDTHESQLTEWKVKEGDTVKTTDILCEIETPEYVYEFQANETGVVAKLLVPEHAEVKPGTMLAYMAKSEDEVASIQAALEEVESKQKLKRRASSSALNVAGDGIEGHGEPHKPIELTEEEKLEEEVGRTQVDKFLAGLEKDLSRYTDVFVEEGFDSLASVKMLTKEDLEALQVKKGHAKIILKAVQDLQVQ